jgi:hypothetical protein
MLEMGLFGKKIEIGKSEVEKINSILPKNLQKDSWSVEDFKGHKLYHRFGEYYSTRAATIIKEISEIKKYSSNALDLKASKVTIYNTAVFDAKPIGYIDHGIVAKFGTASSGNRFEYGMVGAAIEGALDKMWANIGSQYNDIQKAKLELIKKALSIYPNCTSIFKFEIDMQSLGSSGDVFIYVRGTACENKNYQEQIKIEVEKQKLKNEKRKAELEKELKVLQENRGKIPVNADELEEFLKK